MLSSCIVEGRCTDETCGQDLFGEVYDTLVDLLSPPPCKVETHMDPVDEHYPHVTMERTYSILHIALEAHPSLRNTVLQETVVVVKCFEHNRQEWQNQERKKQGELEEYNKQKDM